MKVRYTILIVSLLIISFSVFLRNTKALNYKGYYLNHIVKEEKGVRAYYYNNRDWKGEPVHTCIHKEINFWKIADLFHRRVGRYSFSVKWFGLLRIPVSGWYKFKIASDDGMRLFINGIPLVKNDGVHPLKKSGRRKYLKKGIYPIEVAYFQAKGEGVADLKWRPPDSIKELQGVIPSSVLEPVDSDFKPMEAFRLRMDLRRWNLLFSLSVLILILSIINLPTGFLTRYFFRIPLIIKENVLAFFILAIIFISRLLFIGTLPGIHGDESWFGLTALSFLEGRDVNMLRGLNVYTGPFFLLSIPIYILFGFNAITLRFLPVCFSVLALLFCYILFKRVYDRPTALISIAILGFWPMNFMYSRTNHDIAGFSLFLLFLVLYLLFIKKTWSFLAAGFLLGIGTYVHLLFICVPISLFLLGMIETKGRLVFYRRFYLLVIPIILICSIKVYDIVHFGLGWTFDPAEFSIEQTKYIFKYTALHVLPKIIDGIPLYREFTGKLLVRVIPLNTLVIIICLIALFIKRGLIDKNLLRLIFIIITSYLIINTRIPHPTPRYFYIPVSLLALVFSICMGRILAQGKKLLRYISKGLVVIVLGVNIFYICINYFYSFLKTERGFYVESDSELQYPEYIISHYYIDNVKDLYNFLVNKGLNTIAAIYNIRNNLLFWDIGNNLIYCYDERQFKGRPKEALVFYKEPIPREYSYPEELGYKGLKEIKSVEHFRIYIKNED